MCYRTFDFDVTGHENGITVKTFLRKVCGLTARSMTLLKYQEYGITRDGTLLRAHDLLHEGDRVHLTLPIDKNDVVPVEHPLDICYEDEYLLIVNKPAGTPVHPTKQHQLNTLANYVAYYQQSRGEQYAFRCLNRLDKDTSGCVIIAKDRISYALVKGSIRKVYVAVCEGVIREDGTIDAPIKLSDDSKIRRCVAEDGVAAVTHYRPIKIGEDHTLLELTLDTGRTHQIRCHMSSIGHPLAGDDLYGGKTDCIRRQALHCKSVSMVHPFSGKKISVDTEIPVDINSLL